MKTINIRFAVQGVMDQELIITDPRYKNLSGKDIIRKIEKGEFMHGISGLYFFNKDTLKFDKIGESKEVDSQIECDEYESLDEEEELGFDDDEDE